jgi:hypothetical protein
VQVPLAHGAFDNLGMGTALILNPPRCNARYGCLQQLPAVLVPFLMKGDFPGGWRLEMFAADALTSLVAAPDETWQSVQAAVFRSSVEGGVINARFACIVVSH